MSGDRRTTAQRQILAAQRRETLRFAVWVALVLVAGALAASVVLRAL